MDAVVLLLDKTNDDPYLDAKCFKRGDVIDFMPAGLDWREYPGIVEQVKSGDWGIISIPDLTEAEADSLLASEPGDPLMNKMLQQRFTKIDLAAISDQKLLDDITNLSADVSTTPATPVAQKSTVLEAVVVKQPLKDPNPAVIGPVDEQVIGPS